MSRVLIALAVLALGVGDATAQQTNCQPTLQRPCPPPQVRAADPHSQPYKLLEAPKPREFNDPPPPPIMRLPDGATIGFGDGGVGLNKKW
jgi:hypothetical protein